VNEQAELMTKVFLSSSYFMSAQGHRSLSTDELTDVFRALLSATDGEAEANARLRRLFDYSPATIALNRSQQSQCPGFCSECDCFLPGVVIEDCWCRRRRREVLLHKDKRQSPEYSAWRMAVFTRDCFQCQSCRQAGGQLRAHHKKSYKSHPHLRYLLGNGVTLCEACHRREHASKRGHP